jgi:adenylosuccinate lyase
MKALETLHALSSQARESGMSLRELIENDPEVGSALTPEDLIILDQPERYIGQALEIVDQVVEEIETRRRGDLEKLG